VSVIAGGQDYVEADPEWKLVKIRREVVYDWMLGTRCCRRRGLAALVQPTGYKMPDPIPEIFGGNWLGLGHSPFVVH